MNSAQIQLLLDKLAAALSGGDAQAAALCWEVPALVLHDEGSVAVASLEVVNVYYAQAITSYNQRGDMSLKGELESVVPLTPRLAAVDVRWPGYDAAGQQVSVERSHYIVHLGDDGLARIRVALSLP